METVSRKMKRHILRDKKNKEFNNCKGIAHTLSSRPRCGLLSCPREVGVGMKCTGRVGSSWGEQWSLRCCNTAAWFRTESASHLHDRKWLDPPDPLQNTEGGLRVGERRPVLLVSKLPA